MLTHQVWAMLKCRAAWSVAIRSGSSWQRLPPLSGGFSLETQESGDDE